MNKLEQLLEPVFIFVNADKDTTAIIKELTEIGLSNQVFSDLDAMIATAKRARPFLILCSLCADTCELALGEMGESLPGVPVLMLADNQALRYEEHISGGKKFEVFGLPFKGDFFSKIDALGLARIAAIKQEEEETAFLTKLFSEEALEILEDIDPLIMSLEAGPIDTKVIDLIFRKVHTVKGGSGVTPKAVHIGKLCHEFESCLNAIKLGKLAPGQAEVNLFLSCADLARKLGVLLRDGVAVTSEMKSLSEKYMAALQALREKRPEGSLAAEGVTQVRAPQSKKADQSEAIGSEEDGVFVSNSRLDDFIRLSGEFIIFKNYFDLFCRDGMNDAVQESTKKALKGFSQNINKLTGRLQEQIMDVRKVELGRAFSKLPRMVRQTSQDLGKRVKIIQNGMDLGVDKSLAKALSSAMTHMVRNSLDHGMETPTERRRLGKPEEGSIVLTASESKGVVTVVVRDDGQGINKRRVLAKAIANGMLSEEAGARLSEREIFQLLFLPGFSTAETVTDVSGRGVGMDVVLSTVTALHGTIDIQSKEGEGTEIGIAIPIPKTVVIEKTIIVQAEQFFFAVPITAIAKIDSVAAFPMTRVGSRLTCEFEGKTIRVGNYADFAGTGNQKNIYDVKATSLVVLQYKCEKIGLLVDAVKSQLEAVVRPFDGIIKRVYGCRGTTVIGTSRIAYVLSPEEFVGYVSSKR